MNSSHAIFLVNKGARAILCSYDPNDQFNPRTEVVFKTLDKTIAVDDLVVVPTGTRAGMTVVKVKKVDVSVNFDDQTPMCWIVAKVDTEAHNKLIAQESQLIAAVAAAEFKKRRDDLAEAMFGNDLSTVQALPLASNGKK